MEGRKKMNYYLIKAQGDGHDIIKRRLDGKKYDSLYEAAEEVENVLRPYIMDGGLEEFPMPDVEKETFNILTTAGLSIETAEGLADIVGGRYTTTSVEECIAGYQEEYEEEICIDEETKAKIEKVITADMIYTPRLISYVEKKRIIEYDGLTISIIHEGYDEKLGQFYEIDDETGETTII